MTADTQASRALALLKYAHKRAVFGRRVRVLAEALAAKIPESASVLDIGCGDGTIASLVSRQNPSIAIQGIEIAPRPVCRIPCRKYDGKTIPYPEDSFDLCMFVDVLHHTGGIESLLKEASRVSRKYVLIKDHLAENALDHQTLRLMDWVGNRPHGVVLPYQYQSRAQWEKCFSAAGLDVVSRQQHIGIYPFPFSLVFGRGLHFVALLEKRSAREKSS